MLLGILISIVIIIIFYNVLSKNASENKEVIKNHDKEVLRKYSSNTDVSAEISLNELMQINTVASTIHKEGIARKEVLPYMLDKNIQKLVQIYFPSIYRIILGIDNNKMNDYEAENWFKNKEFISKKIDEFTILASSLANQKSDIRNIRESIEKYIKNSQNEISSKINLITYKGDNGNSNFIDVKNTLQNINKVVEAEKYFNKGTTSFKQGDFIEAINYFEKAGSLGDKDALYQLGNIHLEGNGTVQDFKKAFKFYSESAELGHEKAEYNLGLFYLQGIYVDKDIQTGKKWIKQSSNKGYELAINLLKEFQ